MHFKHPEILYFLFLLIIPILVHLFQLRRFKKEYFTNVRFLKELSIQTRKSSKIKKWLLLCTRLLILAAVILSFAQPFFKAKESRQAQNELYIVVDNSFSMQAKGKKGELLKRTIQDLLQHVPEQQQFSLLTNGEDFWNTDIKSVTSQLQKLSYSANAFSIESQMAKINSKKSAFNKDVIIITDALGLTPNQLKSIPKEFRTYFIVPKAEQKSNVSIDSLYISNVRDNFYELTADLRSFGDSNEDAPISIYNNGKLIAKTMATFEDRKKSMTFTLPKDDYNGYVSIEDNGLAYDNTLYFSISEPEKVNIISIGDELKSGFLSRIYNESEFNYNNYTIAALPYNQLEKQDAIIVNELTDIPTALQTTLKSFAEKGGNIILIPSAQSKPASLNAFVRLFGSISFTDQKIADKLITKISFSHPLYQGVFEKKVTNFQYPSVKNSYGISSTYPAVLSFDDQAAFLTAIPNMSSTVYVFSAPINKDNSNFQNSPLIVPTFFNMAQSTSRSGVAAVTIGSAVPVYVDAQLSSDEIVEVGMLDKHSTGKFIPTQQIMSGKVKLSFGDYPEQAGNYGVLHAGKVVKNLGFNYSRTESSTASDGAKLSLDGFDEIDNIETVFDKMQAERTDNELWKWFAVAALLFLLTEVFIQKFVS